MATITAEDNLAIIEHFADKCGFVSECGYVLWAPIYFESKSDFLDQISDLVLDTQKDREMSELAFCAISYLRFEDEDTEASDTTLYYSLYLFREYSLTRLNEENYLKKMLLCYQNFLAAIFGLRSLFAGENPIDLDPERFAEAYSESLSQPDFISEGTAECKYVPGVTGFSAELTGTVKITMREC